MFLRSYEKMFFYILQIIRLMQISPKTTKWTSKTKSNKRHIHFTGGFSCTDFPLFYDILQICSFHPLYALPHHRMSVNARRLVRFDWCQNKNYYNTFPYKKKRGIYGPKWVKIESNNKKCTLLHVESKNTVLSQKWQSKNVLSY